MAGQAPAQPEPFLNWLAASLAVTGFDVLPPLLQPDGTLTFRLTPDGKSRVSVHWSPAAVEGVGARRVPIESPMYGVAWSDDAERSVILALLESLSSVVSEEDPVFLKAGPDAGEEVRFTPEGLGDSLRRQIRPGKTRFGLFLASEFSQEEPHRLVFGFEAEGGAPRVIVALNAPAGSERFRRRDLSFAIVEDTRSPEQRQRADNQVERLLGFAVGRALANDPEIVVPLPATGEGDSCGDVCCSQGDEGSPDHVDRLHSRVRHEAFIRCWNADYRWRRFIYPQSRCMVNLFHLGPEDALVVHESLECIQNEPAWLPADSAFWHVPRRTRIGEFWQSARLNVTDLNEADVVKGYSMDRLESALEANAARPDCRAVVVVSGCLPNVIGDNPVPAMRRLSRNSKCRYYWVGNTNDFQGYTAALIHDRLAQTAPPSTRRDPLGLAIVGGGSPLENGDLMGLAERVGLRPKGIVLPNVGFDVFERVADAHIFAWANQSALRDISELAFGDLPVLLIRPPAPVGIEGTLEWLRRIVEQTDPELGLSGRLASLEDEDGLNTRLEDLKGRTAGHRLSFVVDPDDMTLLADTRPMYAFSLLDLIAEMGFGLRFLCFGDEGGYSDLVSRFDSETWAGRYDMSYFSTPAELTDALRDPGVGAVFSNVAADPRVTTCGRNVFSEADFEMGFEGFFRTAERLLGRCEVRPLVGYERWLAGAG